MTFYFLLGWRKVSKCKKLIKKLQCRMNVLKNNKYSLTKIRRNDIAQWIRNGRYQTAFDKVEEIYKDECMVAVYDHLAKFCQILAPELSYIWRTKDCPNNVNEAISSLIFASARFAEDLPELLRIRRLFREHYGEHFEATVLGLLPGNLVNSQMREKIRGILSMEKIPNEVKYKLFEEITTNVLGSNPLFDISKFNAERQATKDIHNQYVPATVDSSLNQCGFEPESSFENSTTNEPEEIVYIDNIEEIKSPLRIGEIEIDQRVFVFKSSPILKNHQEHIGEQLKCSRAMSMPYKRLTKFEDEIRVKRSHSLPVAPCSPHVHPKLPDYDELVNTFTVLKKEYLQNSKEISR